MTKELLRRIHSELLDVLKSVNELEIYHDGDHFHELLCDVEAALADQEFIFHDEDKPIAWYDPSKDIASTDKDCPLFTPLGQVWPLHPYPEREWIDLTDTQIERVYFDVVKEHRGAPMPWGQVRFGRALLEKFKEVNS